MRNIGFAVLTLLSLTLPAVAAGTRDDVVQGIVRCGAIADDRQWLDCVYGAAQPMRSHLGLPPAPLVQQRLVPAQGYGTLPGYGGTPAPAYAPRPSAPAPAPKTQDRGFFGSLVGEKNIPDIVSRLASYSFNKQGWFTVTLANGQVWTQISEADRQPDWTRAANSYLVTVSPGAFGTFNLTVAKEPGAYKVRRIK
ncbi:MAG TPA: hypothetical protein VHV26_15720 [Rhizomicrobium sp.]|nr:hypothetical protein [Rhizomicrobium sp.]